MNKKKLIEKKNALLDELKTLTSVLETEERGFTEEESGKYEAIKAEILSLNKAIEAFDEMRDFGDPEPVNDDSAAKKETQEDAEIREFAYYIRTLKVPETRANEQNFTMSNNGVIIPTTIAKMIIQKVVDICPIFANATMFEVKGTLKIPVYGASEEGNDITVGYSEDFVELTANAGEFTSVDLTGYLFGSLSLIGRSLLNSSDIKLVSFVVDTMAKKFAYFIEKEFLTASGSKMQGAINTTNGITAAAQTAITSDELIDLQSSIKQAFQSNAVWTMHSKTFSLIKKLKDENGKYLLQDDITQEFPYRLLGKPVRISDNMPELGASAKPILYGDYSGLAANVRENLSIEILKEKYATQHAIGIVGWMELDCKVMDEQRLAVLTMAE